MICIIAACVLKLFVVLKDRGQGCNFRKLIGGAERGKDAQGTIKILMDTEFTSDLAHFLHNIGGAQLNIGGTELLRHSQIDIKLHL